MVQHMRHPIQYQMLPRSPYYFRPHTLYLIPSPPLLSHFRFQISHFPFSPCYILSRNPSRLLSLDVANPVLRQHRCQPEHQTNRTTEDEHDNAVRHLRTDSQGTSDGDVRAIVPARADLVVSARAGFVVSRAVGNAVVRNKVKRRLRELVRDRLGNLPAGTDLVVRALPAAAKRTYAEMGADLDAALAAARRPRSPRGPRQSSAQERTG